MFSKECVCNVKIDINMKGLCLVIYFYELDLAIIHKKFYRQNSASMVVKYSIKNVLIYKIENNCDLFFWRTYLFFTLKSLYETKIKK